MKISNSKKELARIISENGGWRGGDYASQHGGHGGIGFSLTKPERWGDTGWDAGGSFVSKIEYKKPIKNWHQTILSREEYFHLYPAHDADGWIEWDGGNIPVGFCTLVDVKLRGGNVELGQQFTFSDSWGHRGGQLDIIAYRLHKPEQAKSTAIGDYETNIAAKEELEAMEYKPTIEQLAADYRNAKDYAERKQEEADSAKADADARLKELELAGEALGLVISVAAKPVYTGKFHSYKHGDRPTSLDAICDGCGKRFGTHVGFDCRP